MESALLGIQYLYRDITTRLRFAILALIQAPKFAPILRTKDGVEIDFNKKRIVLPDDLQLHCKGNLVLSSDKHIMLFSGCDQEPERAKEGYVHSIWMNPLTDQQGRPIIDPEMQKMTTSNKGKNNE